MALVSSLVALLLSATLVTTALLLDAVLALVSPLSVLLSAALLDEVLSFDLTELFWTARLVALITSLVALLLMAALVTTLLVTAAALVLAAVALSLLSATTLALLALLLSAALLDEVHSFDLTELFGTAWLVSTPLVSLLALLAVLIATSLPLTAPVFPVLVVV